MYLTDLADRYITVLKGDDSLSDVTIIAAYPYAYKPTRLQKAIIAVSPYQLDVEKEGIGADRYYGDVRIQLSAFVPQEAGSPCVSDVMDRALSAVKMLYPDKITASPIEARDDLECFTTSVILTHRTEAEYGGNNG